MTIIDARPTCFYHPIKVIFLDDSRSFLDALDLEFGTQLNMLTITNPDTVIQTIDNHSQNITKSVFKLMNDVDTDTTTDRVIGFEVSNMLSLIYDKKRFDHVAEASPKVIFRESLALLFKLLFCIFLTLLFSNHHPMNY